MRQYAIVNEATTPLGFDLEAFAKAHEKQLNEHVAPEFGLGQFTVTVYASEKDVPADAELMVFLDNTTQADALAYHFLTATGKPVMRVFVETILADGSSVSAGATHEGVENALDPLCIDCYQVHTTFMPKEVSDATEQDTYKIDDIDVSNFVLDAWFDGNTEWPAGTKFDHMSVCTKPLEIRPGGYQEVWDTHKKNWVETTHAEKPRSKKSFSNRQMKRRHKAKHGHLRGKPDYA